MTYMGQTTMETRAVQTGAGEMFDARLGNAITGILVTSRIEALRDEAGRERLAREAGRQRLSLRMRAGLAIASAGMALAGERDGGLRHGTGGASSTAH